MLGRWWDPLHVVGCRWHVLHVGGWHLLHVGRRRWLSLKKTKDTENKTNKSTALRQKMMNRFRAVQNNFIDQINTTNVICCTVEVVAMCGCTLKSQPSKMSSVSDINGAYVNHMFGNHQNIRSEMFVSLLHNALSTVLFIICYKMVQK